MNSTSTEQPEHLSSEQMSALVASSLSLDEITESDIGGWAGERRVEIRPQPVTPRPGRFIQEFDVVLGLGIAGFESEPERVQATLRVEIYDDGSRSGVVEVGLRVFSPDIA